VSNLVICRFPVRADREDEFRDLLRGHWPLLHGLGFVTDEAPEQFRGADPLGGGAVFFEIFRWKSAEAMNHAHEHLEVSAIWSRMRACVVERDGFPQWEFSHVESI
jgi:hypothetical protein